MLGLGGKPATCGCGRTMPMGRTLCPRCTRTVAADERRGAKASTPAAPYTCAVPVFGRPCGRTVRGGTCPSPDHS